MGTVTDLAARRRPAPPQDPRTGDAHPDRYDGWWTVRHHAPRAHRLEVIVLTYPGDQLDVVLPPLTTVCGLRLPPAPSDAIRPAPTTPPCRKCE